MTPRANSDAMNAQQHPTHQAPFFTPIRTAPELGAEFGLWWCSGRTTVAPQERPSMRWSRSVRRGGVEAGRSNGGE